MNECEDVKKETISRRKTSQATMDSMREVDVAGISLSKKLMVTLVESMRISPTPAK